MKKVGYKRKGRISYITLNHPEWRNDVNKDFTDDKRNGCIDFTEDAEAVVLIISAVGDQFCFGAGLSKGAPLVEFAQQALGMLASAVGIRKPVKGASIYLT